MVEKESYCSIKIISLLKHLVPQSKTEILAGMGGLLREIKVPRVQKPGLTLTGQLESSLRGDRVQVLGNSEVSFLRSQEREERINTIRNLCSFSPCCYLVTKGLDVPPELIEECEANDIPLLRSSLSTGATIELVSRILSKAMAPEITIHGVLLEIFGLGVLMIGDPGIGKSESALDLVTRGHRFVADDAIHVKKYTPDILVGSSYDLIKNLMEIRGLGIINIRDLFGMSAVRDHKRIELVISLVTWKKGETYDRLGLHDDFYTIMGAPVSLHKIPVAPGRNLAVIIETAARNYLVRMSYGKSSYEFEKKMNKKLIEKSSRLPKDAK